MTQLIDKTVLAAYAEQAELLFKRSLKDAVDRARASATSTQRMTAPDWDPAPFSFERSGDKPGKPSATGEWQQSYDAQRNLLLREQKRGYGTHYTVYERVGQRIDVLAGTQGIKGDWELSVVGQVAAHASDVRYALLTPRGRRYHAVVWRTEQDRAVEIEEWAHDGVGPSTTKVDYDAAGKPTLTRDGEVIFPRAKRRKAPPIPKLATTILSAVRAQLARVTEPILALTLSYSSGDTESIPPPVSFVLRRTAQDHAHEPSRTGDLWQIWDAGDDPGNPLVSFDKKALALDWQADEMEEKLGLLTDALNAQREPGEPPFVLVDLHGAANKHFARIPSADRAALEPFLK